LSGNNNTLYGGGVGYTPGDPTYTTNAWGDPVFRFASTNAATLATGGSASLEIAGQNSAAISIVAVVNFASTGATNCEIVNITGNTPTTDLNIPAPYDYYLNGATAGLFRGNGAALGDGNSYGQYTAPNGPSIGVPHVLVVSEYGNAVNHYVDGNLVGAGILNGGFPVANIAYGGNPFYVGWRGDGVQALNGDLAELIVAGSALSTYDVTQLTSYLSQVHNLVLPGTSPANLVASKTAANQLTLSWPTNYTGWILQAQTNSVSSGISTNWVNVGNSTGTNVIVMPINAANGCVFYRLIYAP